MTFPNLRPVLDYCHCVDAGQSGGMVERLKQGGWATPTGHSPRLGLPTVNIKIIRTLGVIIDGKKQADEHLN